MSIGNCILKNNDLENYISELKMTRVKQSAKKPRYAQKYLRFEMFGQKLYANLPKGICKIFKLDDSNSNRYQLSRGLKG